MTSEEKFREIEEMFKRLSNEMSIIVSAFYLWRGLILARSTVEAGEEQAQKNVETMSIHKYFFLQSEESFLTRFIIGITKFYDPDSRSLTINTLIKKLREYQNDIDANVLIKLYPDRLQGDEVSNYMPFNEADVQDVETLRETNKIVIQNLKNIRNKNMAHMDMKLIKVVFVPNEVETLINDTQEMFNKLQHRFGCAITDWRFMREEPEREIDILLENIALGEKKRKEEIKARFEAKWNIKLK